MRIDSKEYLKQIKYTDWVKSDSQYDYSVYADAYYADAYEKSGMNETDNLPPFMASMKVDWVKPLLVDDADWGFDSAEHYWDWVCSEGHDDLLCQSIDERGMGFYANKFVWLIYDVYTTNRRWNENKEEYGEHKSRFGARCYLLKLPPAQIKKEARAWAKELDAWGLNMGVANANQWIKTHGYPYDTLDWHNYFVEYSIGDAAILENTLKAVKRKIKYETCRMIYQNPHLFPLTYGVVNHRRLKNG